MSTDRRNRWFSEVSASYRIGKSVNECRTPWVVLDTSNPKRNPLHVRVLRKTPKESEYLSLNTRNRDMFRTLLK